MKIDCYLIITKTRRYRYSTRTTAKKPKLDSNEVALKLNLEIPDEVFARPQMQASITVSPEMVSPPVIDAEVVNNIAEAIKREMGIDLNITVLVPDQVSGGGYQPEGGPSAAAAKPPGDE